MEVDEEGGRVAECENPDDAAFENSGDVVTVVAVPPLD